MAAPVQYTPFPAPGKIPSPIPEIKDPTPAERAEAEAKAKAAQQAAKDTEVKAQAEEKKKGGFLAKVTAVANEVANTAQKTALQAASTVQKEAKKLVDEHATKRFSLAFPELATEQLLGDYACKAVHNVLIQHTLTGFLDVTDKHVCFVGDNKTNVAIPLQEIVSLQLGVSLPTENQGQPFIMQLPNPQVIPTTIQIYTRKNVHQFTQVKDIRDAINVLDHAVRAVTKLPAADVEYA